MGVFEVEHRFQYAEGDLSAPRGDGQYRQAAKMEVTAIPEVGLNDPAVTASVYRDLETLVVVFTRKTGCDLTSSSHLYEISVSCCNADSKRENESMFYAGRRVLVTGGASFIGSHLVEDLVKDGAIVTVADDLSSGRIEHLASCIDAINFIHCDLRNSDAALNATKGQQTVFHLANIHGGRGFIETHPGEIAQNLLIDGNVFKASLESAIENICYTSSACVYPTHLQDRNHFEQARFLSEEIVDPLSDRGAAADGVYGWCKLMGEMALASYHRQFGLRGVSCRLFTVYGPRENESHAIMAFMARAITRQDPFEIWGSGQQDRNFTYVADAIEGLKRAASQIFDGSAINIGTDEITSVLAAAKLICDIEGYTPSQFHCDTTKPEGVFARAASVDKQVRVLGWRPSVLLKDGLSKTFAHYRLSNTMEQIESRLKDKLFAR